MYIFHMASIPKQVFYPVKIYKKFTQHYSALLWVISVLKMIDGITSGQVCPLLRVKGVFKIAQYIVISPVYGVYGISVGGAPVLKLESILILTCLSGLQCTVVVLRCCSCNPAGSVGRALA